MPRHFAFWFTRECTRPVLHSQTKIVDACELKDSPESGTWRGGEVIASVFSQRMWTSREKVFILADEISMYRNQGNLRSDCWLCTSVKIELTWGIERSIVFKSLTSNITSNNRSGPDLDPINQISDPEWANIELALRIKQIINFYIHFFMRRGDESLTWISHQISGLWSDSDLDHKLNSFLIKKKKLKKKKERGHLKSKTENA